MIEVAQGAIQGTEIDSMGVVAFLGLPYAAAPIGALRFEPPQPARRWEGVLKATRFGPRSIQRRPFADLIFRSREMSEDCLTINVWTPASGTGNALLPILFYIHGGSFLVGDASEPRHDGASLAARGIIVATVNFRLGLFGFFSHPELRGANAGLLDLAAALDWVQENAIAFGGNPSKITVVGSSSGGFAACALACSPRTKDKVAGVIVQSGSLLGTRLVGLSAELTTHASAQLRGRRFAEAIGADSLNALKALPAADLLKESSATGWNRPVIDGSFLRDDPYSAYVAGDVARVPFMAGMTSAERSFDVSRSKGSVTIDSLMARLRRDYSEHAEAVYALYGRPKTKAQLRIACCNLDSEEWIGIDTFRFCQAISSAGGTAYSYLFDHSRPEPSPNSGGWTSHEGAGHSTDTEYFLGNQHLMGIYAWTMEDRQLSALMQTHIVNFVKTGNPNGRKCPEWPSFDTGKRVVLSRTGGIMDFERIAKLTDLKTGTRQMTVN